MRFCMRSRVEGEVDAMRCDAMQQRSQVSIDNSNNNKTTIISVDPQPADQSEAEKL